MVLGEVVCQVIGSFLPEYLELLLCNTISNPVESHVDCFGALLFYCSVGYAFGALIVGDDDGGGLYVS